MSAVINHFMNILMINKQSNFIKFVIKKKFFDRHNNPFTVRSATTAKAIKKKYLSTF